MSLIMCRGNWPGVFHRTLGRKVDPKSGAVTVEGRRVAFPPGQAVEVSDEDLQELLERGDIGPALLPCVVDEKGRARIEQETLDDLLGAAAESTGSPVKRRNAVAPSSSQRSRAQKTLADSSESEDDKSTASGEGADDGAASADNGDGAEAAADAAAAKAAAKQDQPKRRRRR